MIQSNIERKATLVDLCDLRFDNSFVRELPGDPLLRNVPRAVRNACYTRVDPTPVRSAAAARLGRRGGRNAGHRAPGLAHRPGGRSARRQSRACRACSPTPRATADTSSATGRGSSATVVPSPWAKWSARTARATSCSSRARARRRTRAPPTAARCCAPRCASSCAARPCTISACRPRAR